MLIFSNSSLPFHTLAFFGHKPPRTASLSPSGMLLPAIYIYARTGTSLMATVRAFPLLLSKPSSVES